MVRDTIATGTSPLRRKARLISGGARILAAMAIVLLCPRLAAQSAASPLPFAPGEQCVYRGNGPLGRMGTGSFSVDLDSARSDAWVLRFDFRGHIGIIGVENHTRSWFIPRETASFRFTKTERSPFSTKRQDVRMDPGSGRWTALGDAGGELATAAPLDELSFVFFLRTLRLAADDSYSFDRHYDPARNPVRVRVVGRGTLRVPAGEFHAVEVEMRVRDRSRYGGEGVIRIHFTDDARHLPLRLESQIPVAGHMVLVLESLGPACGTPSSTVHAAD